MIQSGIVSVTFRALSPERVVEIVRAAGLDGIEWGGDVHVPSADPQRAREIGRQTRDTGLTVFSYGSYYRTGDTDERAPRNRLTNRALVFRRRRPYSSFRERPVSKGNHEPISKSSEKRLHEAVE